MKLPEAMIVEVRVTHAELVSQSYALSAECFVVQKLKEAGIPVLGTLLYTGLAAGTLHISRDWDNDCIFYRWFV